MVRPRFHLAIAVDDLDAARVFYGDLMGCMEGRSTERWVDYEFFGHQISLHHVEAAGDVGANPVDGDISVPGAL